jgi:hypothetical protein
MRVKTAMVSFLSAALLSFGGLGMAQDQHQHEGGGAKGPQGPGGMMGGRGGGMMGGGMGGMMSMIQQCERLMGARGGHAMPQLPPGNEKLQLQMHAEIMQRVGEILAKYAGQVK